MKKYTYILFCFLLFEFNIVYAQQTSITIGSETKNLKPYSAFAVTTDETARCLNCHSTKMPKLVENWEHSTHAKNGVGCYECHKAEKGDKGTDPFGGNRRSHGNSCAYLGIDGIQKPFTCDNR